MKTIKIIHIFVIGLLCIRSVVDTSAYCYDINNYNNLNYNNYYYNSQYQDDYQYKSNYNNKVNCDNNSNYYHGNNYYYDNYNNKIYYDSNYYNNKYNTKIYYNGRYYDSEEYYDIYNYDRNNYYHEYYVPSPKTSNIRIQVDNYKRTLIMPDIIDTYIPPVPTNDTIANIEPTNPLWGFNRVLSHLTNGIKEVVTTEDEEKLKELHRIYDDFQLKTQIYTYLTTKGAIFKLTSRNNNIITQLQSKNEKSSKKGYIVGNLSYSTSMTLTFSSISNGIEIAISSYDPYIISAIQKESKKISEENLIEKDITKQANGITVILTSHDNATISKLQNETYNSPQFFW